MIDADIIRQKIEHARQVMDSINSIQATDDVTRLQLDVMHARCTELIQMLEGFLGGTSLG